MEELTPVEDSHGVVVRLLLQVVFGVLLSLFDDGIGWELDGVYVKVLRLIDIWSLSEDFASIYGDSGPPILSDFVVVHDKRRSSRQCLKGG